MGTNKTIYRIMPIKENEQIVIGFVSNRLIVRDTLTMARRNQSCVLVSHNNLPDSKYDDSLSRGAVYEGHDMRHWKNDLYNTNNILMADAKYVIIKVKPAIVQGIHRFEVVQGKDKIRETRKGMQSILDSYNKKVMNLNDTFYCLGMVGTRISWSTWLKNASIEEPHHTHMRRILKKPNIWRSYPNLYPVAKKSIPHFLESGESLNPEVALTTNPQPLIAEDNLRLPKSLSYANVHRMNGQVKATFNSPNVKSFADHGYSLMFA